MRKDEALDRLAERINVAQFVAFQPAEPNPRQTFSRILGDKPNHVYPNLRDAIERLLERSPERSVNVRSFSPDDYRSRPFDYGLKMVDDVEAIVRDRLGQGLFAIINETVDIFDGGVSGVVEGGTAEFAPDDTPRCVEKPGTASLPLVMARELISKVYGVAPKLNLGKRTRLEFSIHPRNRGWRNLQVLGWETANKATPTIEPRLHWPNRFSRMIGDKAYGLIMADLAECRVPSTTVYSRRLAPFSLGIDTGTAEVWVRTCPLEPMPGLYATKRGWIEPFTLLKQENPKEAKLVDPDTGESSRGFKIPSVIVQSGVRAVHSGSTISNADREPVIEGVKGTGDAFMLGKVPPERLPRRVRTEIKEAWEQLSDTFGPTRFEWVHDGEHLWIVQLHRGSVESAGSVVVPGEPRSWISFDPSEGLPALRQLVGTLGSGVGLMVTGKVGLTSHIADILRRSGRPARLS